MWKGISANSPPSLYITQYPCERKVYRQIRPSARIEILASFQIALSRQKNRSRADSDCRKHHVLQQVTKTTEVCVDVIVFEYNGWFYSQKS